MTDIHEALRRLDAALARARARGVPEDEITETMNECLLSV